MDSKNIEEVLAISDVKTKAIKSVKWTALREIVSRSIQPIVILILAKLLTPADFGVVAVAMIATGLARIFQDFGLGKTLIQRETEVDKSANIIFWTNVTLSVFIYLILFISAPLLSKFFHEPKVIGVLRVLCLQIILFSLISVHQALFQRQFKFKQLFFIRLFSAAIPGLVSIPLALFGYGVWALVFGTLASAVVQVLVFWKVSSWRPQFSYDFHLAKQLWKFGGWVTLEGFLSWLIMYGDSIAVGKMLSTYELGIYRVGLSIISLVFGVFIFNALPVVYSFFCRFGSAAELKLNFIKINEMFFFICALVGMGLFSSSNLITLLTGEKWLGLNVVIMALATREIFSCLTMGTGPEIYRAIGKPNIHPKIMFLASIIYIPIYFWVAQYGLTVFVWIRALLSIIVGNGLHFYYLNKLIKINVKDIISIAKVPVMSLSLCLTLFFSYRWMITRNTIILEVFACLALIIIFVGFTAIFDKKRLIRLLTLIPAIVKAS